jgi:hypothetical protein
MVPDFPIVPWLKYGSANDMQFLSAGAEIRGRFCLAKANEKRYSG